MADGCGRPGWLVTFEGGEGAGKSTQVRRLRERLCGLGRPVIVTREPGGPPRAEAIRQALLGGAVKRYGPMAETLLFAAARAAHVDEVIRPGLGDGAIVLCDRYIDSTRVYQGGVAGVGLAVLHRLEQISIGTARPDLTLVLDLPAELGLARARARRLAAGAGADRFEREGAAYHEKVRCAFLRIAHAEPDRCVVIDASLDAGAVEAAIRSAVSALLERSREGRVET